MAGRWAAALVVTIGAAATAAPTDGSALSNDERAVLRVAERAQAAVLADRPRAVCRLLTRRARRNSLILYGLNRHPDGRPRPKARTCTRAVGYMIDDERSELWRLRAGEEYHATELAWVRGSRAKVTKFGGTRIYLVKRKGRWRGDWANFAPWYGGSGY